MAIHPKEIATSSDKHNDTVLQFHRVQAKIDSLLADYFAVKRLKPVSSSGIWSCKFYFSGDIYIGLVDLLNTTYKKNSWMGVTARGWRMEDFLKSPDCPESVLSVEDIGGNKDHVFEVEISCMNMFM